MWFPSYRARGFFNRSPPLLGGARLNRPKSTKACGLQSRRLIKQHARALLDQKLSLLQKLDQDQYVFKHPNFFGASIGGHIRHSLDHFKRALAATQTKEVGADASASASASASPPVLSLDYDEAIVSSKILKQGLKGSS